MDYAKLSDLSNMNVRDVWGHEANDFTPWLSDNLDRLSAKLGVNLEFEVREVQVGSYRADIVARVPEDDTRVPIENQLEYANLQHLGQVLAYLVGLEAKIVVWVAAGFGDAHLSAIRWLNEHTRDLFAFFAVRIRVALAVSRMIPRPSLYGWNDTILSNLTRKLFSEPVKQGSRLDDCMVMVVPPAT